MEHPLRHYRIATGRTLEALAADIGVSKSQVCKYERGTRLIPATRVPAISELTGIPRHLLRPDVYREPAS